MRLHRLSVTAFGPFVETAEVDFDRLSEAGLFLLSGPTGAGKSSVLDAVCFALYGAVPGDRQHAGRLRSDQAPPALAPSVTLEAGLSGRRFRIVRSPAWERPKKRGTGTTREQARVVVSERVADAWVPLTTRLDEAGDLLSGLLGMSLDQFCQVALLPQGHFQAFLRADSAARHQLLSRLFRTGRFERVEAWLRDHRLELRRACDAQGLAVSGLVSRVSEAASAPVPEALADIVAAADDGALAEWAGQTLAAATVRRTTTRTALHDAEQDERAAREAWEAARARAADRERVAGAAEVVGRLEADAPALAIDRERLGRAQRARGLRPLVGLADQRRAALDARQAAWAASRSEVERAGLDPDDLAAELDRVTETVARFTALLPAEQRLLELDERRRILGEQLAGLDDDERLGTAECEAVTALIREGERAAEEDDVAPAALTEAEADAAAAQAVATAHDLLSRLVPEREAVGAEHDDAVRRVLEAREQLLTLRERRIAGMAAELAGALAVGDDCPVCGSVDHPRPAPRAAGHPGAGAERAAQRAVDDAQAAEHALELRLRDLDAALASARAAAGDLDAAEAECTLSKARQALTDLRGRADRHAQHLDRLGAARTRATQLEAAGAERRVRRAELATVLEQVAAEGQRLESALADARGEHSALDAAVVALEARRDLVRRALDDSARRTLADTARADAEAALARAAGEAGFASPDSAREAELAPAELDELDRRVQEYDVALAAARSVLDEAGAQELLAGPEPDVPACEQRLRSAGEALERCRSASEHAERVRKRVARLTDALTDALREWSPVRQQLALATSVSSFAEGKASDNRWQMRLSAYVLGYRLSQVVAAANARLAGMSDRRYSLEHVGQRGARDRRGGLSLAVRDDWSGESRDPATLSGGETFVVSLALALGLADVVAHEAGGADLQTLFVDEGFGALDAETLDDVLDILDTLRENGRAVGVVSHVPEMRDRIPTQLVVDKARTGSRVRIAG